jgi:hypothetical protein
MKYNKLFRPVYANEVDGLAPEIWAQETLALLEERMVMGNLVHRDFSEEIAQFGDVVNADRPQAFTAKRKGDGEVKIQSAKSTSIPVKLNQHLHTSFMITDKQLSLSMKDLVDMFMRPAASSLGSGVDKACMGVVPQFFPNYVGRLDTMTPSNSVEYLAKVRQKAEELKWDAANRHFVITPATESILLQTPQFTSAEKIGDDGTAIREASLGRRFGFSLYGVQNTPYALVDNCEVVVGAVNNGAGYAAGTTSLTVDNFSAAIVNGSYVTIAGSMFPYRVASTVGGATPTTIVLSTGLKDAVLNDAVIRIYTPMAVNLSAGYANGYVEDIAVDGFNASYPPFVGRIIADAAGNLYTVSAVSNIVSSEADIMPSSPLAGALANDAVLGLAPAGSYNLAFTPQAIALVTRPLAMPRAGNVSAAVVNYKGLSMRAVISYLPKEQGHLVTLDLLCGVTQLDVNQGIVMFA